MWSLFFTAAAWLMIGSTPFVDFVRYQLPRIESGEAFFWMENADAAAINFGIHGLVIKLRFLGLPWTGHDAANRAASLYAVILVLLAFVSAWRLQALASGAMEPERLRLRRAQVWLGLLSLASFRSPFVPDAYALFGTLWLLTLVAAEGHWQARGRTRARRGCGDIDDRPRWRSDHRSRAGVDHGGDARPPGRGDRVQHGDRAHARPGAARRTSAPRAGSCGGAGGRRLTLVRTEPLFAPVTVDGQATFGTPKCCWMTSVTAPRSRGCVVWSVGTMRVGVSRKRPALEHVRHNRTDAVPDARHLADDDDELRRQAGHDRRQPRTEELRHAVERLDGAAVAALGELEDVFEPQPRL